MNTAKFGKDESFGSVDDSLMADMFNCLGKCKADNNQEKENMSFWMNTLSNDTQKSSKDIMRKPRSVKEIDWLL